MKELEELELKIKEIKESMNDENLCQGTASTYSRITGYYRPVNAWNVGKKAEYLDRKEYGI